MYDLLKQFQRRGEYNNEGYGRFFRTEEELTIHQKRTHRKTDKAPIVTWEVLKQEGAWQNHKKICSGSRIEGKKKECHVCKTWLIGSNLTRHMRIVNDVTTRERASS